MADMSSILVPERRAPSFPDSLAKDIVLTLDFGLSANASMLATGTHNILDWPAGQALLWGKCIVQTTMTSTSNDGTISFALTGLDALHATMTADGTELAAGDGFMLGEVDYEDAAGKACYSATATHLDMTIATHAMTAGKLILYLRVINILDIQQNG